MDRQNKPDTIDWKILKELQNEGRVSNMDLIQQLATNHEMLITIEEGATGGFGAQVLHALAKLGLLDRGLKIRSLTLPDEFTAQAKPEIMYAHAGLDKNGIMATAIEALGLQSAHLPLRA